MFKPAYGVGGTLLAGISASANLMQPSVASYSQMSAALGEAGTDHTYMLLSDGVNVELVKVTQLNEGYASIVRGQDGTTAAAFALGSIIYFDMTGAAVTDMITAALDAAALPSGLTFVINEPHTADLAGSVLTLNIEKLPLTSPDGTVDVTTVGDGYGIDIERGAFGCCPTT